jgi:YVTN family beta-propeller protein
VAAQRVPRHRNTVSIVDPGAGAVRETVPVGTGPVAIAEAGGGAWITAGEDGDVWRLSTTG